MPYPEGERLPGERASRLGHLDVLKSPLVKRLVDSFEETASVQAPQVAWAPIPGGEPLPIVFAVDGSIQTIVSDIPPRRALSFVKTALLRIDRPALAGIDPESPHPYILRDLLADAALYHATVFPMRHITVPGTSLYDAVRRCIFESVKDASLDGEPMETLKWLAYEKWASGRPSVPPFECPYDPPHDTTLSYDAEEAPCPVCGKQIFLTDMLGFHLEMAPDSAPDSVASAYMSIHETLLLFTGIRYFWEHNRNVLGNCLFVKDGPLSLRAQYSKLVNPIRRFLESAQKSGVTICVVGQEKTGAFAEHLELIGESAPPGSFFLPGHTYIREEIQHRPVAGMPYGRDTNYGSKVFVRLNERHRMVLNVPTGGYVQDPQAADLIGLERILASLGSLTSAKHENALLPVELANNVASLSTYPSAHILKMFAEAAVPATPR